MMPIPCSYSWLLTSGCSDFSIQEKPSTWSAGDIRNLPLFGLLQTDGMQPQLHAFVLKQRSKLSDIGKVTFSVSFAYHTPSQRQQQKPFTMQPLTKGCICSPATERALFNDKQTYQPPLIHQTPRHLVRL